MIGFCLIKGKAWISRASRSRSSALKVGDKRPGAWPFLLCINFNCWVVISDFMF